MLRARGHLSNGISIHALREEGDDSWRSSKSSPSHFYPRPPRGGRQGLPRDSLPPGKFLSTPSARRATVTDQVSHGGRIFLSTPSARRATP